ncbi:MAG TPA: hypothetical protein VMZ25_09265 [Terriglobales bacterium]|nr:hypothetical protein [Terriglobales bacterium]
MYIRNRYCPCLRCKMNDMMGPALLVSFGVMLLLANVTHGSVRGGTIVAVILIVIGAIKLLQGSASTEGHIPPGSLPAGVVPPVPPAPTTTTTPVNTEVQNG